MEINSISLLFKCSQCPSALESIHAFLDHKLENHLLEFKTTKCILFEEIILPDEDFTSKDETEFVNYSNIQEDDGSLEVEQTSTIQFSSTETESSSDQPKSSKRLKLNDYETETVVSLTTTEAQNDMFDPLAVAIKQETIQAHQLVVPYFEDNFENPTLQDQSGSPYLLGVDVKTAISQSIAETTETETETQENNSDEAFENFNSGSQEVETNVSVDTSTSSGDDGDDDSNPSDSHSSEPHSPNLNSSTVATGSYNFEVAKVKYEPDLFAEAEPAPEPEPTMLEEDIEILADLSGADELQQTEIDPSDPDYEPRRNRRQSRRNIAFKSRSKNTTIPSQDSVAMPKLVAKKKTKLPTKTAPFVFPSYETFRGRKTRKTNKIDDDESDLRTWLLTQRSRFGSDENIILIQPDPVFNITSTATETVTSESLQSKPHIKTSPSNPIHCALCCTKLESDEAVKVHVTYCWLKNKAKHRYCFPCKRTFQSAFLLQKHNHQILLQEIEDNDPSFGDPNKYLLLQCKHCLQGFTAQMYLNHHMHSHHRKKNTNVIKKFRRSSSSRSSTSTTLRRSNTTATATASASATKAVVHGGFRQLPLKREGNQKRKREIGIELKQMAVAANAPAKAKFIKCKVCPRTFDIGNFREFRTHWQSHYRSEAQNFNCKFPNCTQAFKSKHNLEIHFNAHTIGKAIAPNNVSPGPSGPSVIIEDQAGKSSPAQNTFAGSSEPPILEREVELKLEPEPVPVLAPVVSNHAADYLNTFEKQKKLVRPCSVNVANSRVMSNKLKKMMQSSQTLSLPLFVCQICNCTFDTKSSLEAHALVHLNEEQSFKFKCTFSDCVWSFKEKGQLLEHLRAHGKKTKKS